MSVFSLLKKSRAGLALLVCALLILCAFAVEAVADKPLVKVSFKNEAPQMVRIALIYTTAGGEARKWGWSFIEPGKSKTITLPRSVSPKSTMEEAGYYAESIPEAGESKIVWRGEYREIQIRDGDFNDTAETTYKNGNTVKFRKINLKPANDGGAVGAITLKP